MDLDNDKIDQAALALLYLARHEDHRAWKSLDWDITSRLHEKGMISDPVNKTKSVNFTEDGLRAAEEACRRLFAK
jgi:hypothetical protein